MTDKTEKIPVLVIVGPTASGKTALAVEAAEKLDGEVVSADSMQIYRGMDIATAKPSHEEMRGIPHHMISIIDPDRNFSVADFQRMASNIINDIHDRGKTPVVAGGTGLYIDSLLQNVKFPDVPESPEVRRRLVQRAADGMQPLWDELNAIDPATAQKLHVNNRGRIIRALEVYYASGVTMSEYVLRSRSEPSPYEPVMIGLNFRDRQKLYDRINRRVDAMLEAGLVDEARRYFELNCGGTAAQAIGYKELYPYLKGEIDLESAVENLKMQTRRYAKRQLTWFRRNENINWLYLDEKGSSVEVYI